MDPSLIGQPPPEVVGDWLDINCLDTACSIESWWDSFSKWITLSMYEQIHKIELVEVWIDGVLSPDRTSPFSLAELKQLASENRLPTTISYKRRLYPKDYLRKSEVDDCVTHYLHENRCVYKPYIPNNDPNQLAYFYLQAYAFCFSLLNSKTLYEFMLDQKHPEMNQESSNELSKNENHQQSSVDTQASPKLKVLFKVIPFNDPALHSTTKLEKVAVFYLKHLDKWDKAFRAGGYQKRVYHDVVVPLDLFTKNYRRLKEKYNHWVVEWEESTDPAKFVYEDVGIAAFLISLWENDSSDQHGMKKTTFIDIGCGNGFLVYLLTMEGYQGRGIDLVKRKIWAKYPSEVRLEESAIQPPTDVFTEDWIIANHSDELTPWVPLIASRNNNKFFVLPCCEWNFDSKYTVRTKSLSRYESYLEYIKMITEKSGYKVEVEHLRIPSTRNISIIGQTRTIDVNDPEQVEQVKQNQEECLKKAKYQQFSPRVAPPKCHVKAPKGQRPKKLKDKGSLHPSKLNQEAQQESDENISETMIQDNEETQEVPTL